VGEAPVGIIVYTADGTMITTISAPGRPRIDGNDPVGGPDDQRLAALETFIAYSGTYHIDGPDVIHDVAISLYPNWVENRSAAMPPSRKSVGPLPSVRTGWWSAAGRASSASCGNAFATDRRSVAELMAG
jgi:hypothetical protein